MQYQVFAADYDGTLANRGHMSDAIVAALQRVADSGRKILLVTGREIPDLIDVCPQIAVFDWVVAENGAVLYSPRTKESIILTSPPAAEFIYELRRRNIRPLSVGECIVSTLKINRESVLHIINGLALNLQIISNKTSIMILPAGVNKAFGLKAVLQRLQLSSRSMVAIGDGENDHALLDYAGYSVAVENAVPMLKKIATRTLIYPNGEGSIHLMNELIADDLKSATTLPDLITVGKNR